ncbi:hypothetical protein ABIE21_001074 [Conyzicola nivalis]|uniref:Uncharacterized protein n=1 Tax=Conyzicola nivalis TaxID=1477021 RepID=A0ABV2QKL5_9MICO
MSLHARHCAKVTAIGLGVVFVPAAALEGLNYLAWVNEGVNGTAWARTPFALGFLPSALWLLPVVLVVAVLVAFFSGDVPGSKPAADESDEQSA